MKKIIILIICFLLCSCKTDEVFRNTIIDEYSPESSKITLSMLGDAVVDASIYKDAYIDGKYDFSSIFSELKSEIYNSDLMYYNQESVFGGQALGYSGYPRYNAPEEFGEAMINLGFNLVSRANNHTLDKGEAGVLNACNFWNRFPSVLSDGSSCTKAESETIKTMEIAGIKVALLSYTMIIGNINNTKEYYVKKYSDELVKREIEKIKTQTDIILVAMHWGEKYNLVPNDTQKRIAKYLASLGVDIIVGTHPHVIQPIEWISDTLVIYSLGNMLSSQSTKNDYSRRIGLLANVDITKTTTKEKTKVSLGNLKTSLVYTYSKNNKEYKVVPFSKLDETLLKDYRNLKVKYDSIIKYYDSSILTE